MVLRFEHYFISIYQSLKASQIYGPLHRSPETEIIAPSLFQCYCVCIIISNPLTIVKRDQLIHTRRIQGWVQILSSDDVFDVEK